MPLSRRPVRIISAETEASRVRGRGHDTHGRYGQPALDGFRGEEAPSVSSMMAAITASSTAVARMPLWASVAWTTSGDATPSPPVIASCRGGFLGCLATLACRGGPTQPPRAQPRAQWATTVEGPGVSPPSGGRAWASLSPPVVTAKGGPRRAHSGANFFRFRGHTVIGRALSPFAAGGLDEVMARDSSGLAPQQEAHCPVRFMDVVPTITIAHLPDFYSDGAGEAGEIHPHPGNKAEGPARRRAAADL